MSLSSVTVVANALRLKGFKPTAAVKSGETAETGAVLIQSLGLAPKKTEVITAENATADRNNNKGENEITGGLTMEKVLKVEGMTCGNCQKHVRNALSKMEGVTGVEVSLEAKTATVQATRDIPVEEFEKVIADAGYELVK
jgi:Cu+-exporting ATPase